MTDNTQPQSWTLDDAILAISAAGGSGEFANAETDKEAAAAEKWLRAQFADHAAAAKLTAAYAEADALAQALEIEDDAYELGLANGSEDWETCTRIMVKYLLSLELSSTEAADMLTFRARQQRRAALTAHAERVKARNGIIPLDERRHV